MRSYSASWFRQASAALITTYQVGSKYSRYRIRARYRITMNAPLVAICPVMYEPIHVRAFHHTTEDNSVRDTCSEEVSAHRTLRSDLCYSRGGTPIFTSAFRLPGRVWRCSITPNNGVFFCCWRRLQTNPMIVQIAHNRNT